MLWANSIGCKLKEDRQGSADEGAEQGTENRQAHRLRYGAPCATHPPHDWQALSAGEICLLPRDPKEQQAPADQRGDDDVGK